MASLAHRKLRQGRFGRRASGGLVRYHDARDEPGLVTRFGTPAEAAIGYYENPSGVEPSVIVVTERGIRFPTSPRRSALDYADIVAIEGPADKFEGPRELVVVTRGARRHVVPVEGRDGRYQDLYVLWTFLRNAVDLAATRP